MFFKLNKNGMFVKGGIHAREWISPTVVMYILHQLLTSKDLDVRNIAENYDWYIFPSFNPDGYVYTHTTVSARCSISHSCLNHPHFS
ncbi:zinc carboxypeptidase-like [Harpegnathos saltator]|uniref:Zinc carboxypeptidase A 1 n=1 Tax=Harpegnathos saltator TaxID=610380 RepID=E2BYF2_HARSA|nr:zinc carboxypeptidase-like [Harpegnathos saltator]EFN79278.1 Zinc carboxypeptidase A 1 [Harpegnathos saltator]